MTAPQSSVFSTVGPFARDADATVRSLGLARLCSRLYTMAPLPDRRRAASLCSAAAVDPNALPLACAALDALPSLDRRKLLHALLPFAGTHSHPTKEG